MVCSVTAVGLLPVFYYFSPVNVFMAESVVALTVFVVQSSASEAARQYRCILLWFPALEWREHFCSGYHCCLLCFSIFIVLITKKGTCSCLLLKTCRKISMANNVCNNITFWTLATVLVRRRTTHTITACVFVTASGVSFQG